MALFCVGYPSVIKDMHTTFLTWGPIFKLHTVIKPFENVDVFNLVKSILGLNYTGKIDGTDKLAHTILVKGTND